MRVWEKEKRRGPGQEPGGEEAVPPALGCCGRASGNPCVPRGGAWGPASSPGNNCG